MIDLLERLEGVRSTGADRWLARCPGPNHENGDRHPSLSVRLIEGERWLLFCFASCLPNDVCKALGLSLADLFHDRLIRREHVHGRDRSGRTVPKVRAADFLELLNHEAGVVALIGADMHSAKVIDVETWERLARAYRRISTLRAECAL